MRVEIQERFVIPRFNELRKFVERGVEKTVHLVHAALRRNITQNLVRERDHADRARAENQVGGAIAAATQSKARVHRGGADEEVVEAVAVDVADVADAEAGSQARESPGEINPDHISTAGVFVQRIIHVPNAVKHIEQRTVRKRA